MRLDGPKALRAAASASVAILLVAVGLVSAIVGEGARGLFYLIVFIVATAPGWAVGRALFGIRHPAAWIAGGLMGYVLTALALWTAIASGVPSRTGFLVAWTLISLAAAASVWRVRSPLVDLPAWRRQDTIALALVLLLVPALVGRPFARIGEPDAQGHRQYRAYFTADFLWHTALTAELARFEMPPQNPYAADITLHYYWTYFLLPAAAPAVIDGLPRETEARLLVNATGAGLLFVAAIALLAWTAVPHALPMLLAVTVALVASSAEGLYALYDTWATGQPLDWLRNTNIDALTAWRFRSLRIDGLPRSLWYTPQHAMSCALGLVALVVASRGGAHVSAVATAIAGLALALALMVSPFPAGAFAVIYAVVVLWDAVREPRRLPRAFARQGLALVPIALALGWCMFNQTFEGADEAVRIGLSSLARSTGPLVLAIKLGPILVMAIAGLLVSLRGSAAVRAGITGMGVGLGLLYLVWLEPEPVWIGWRAGQILLVTLPVLAAAAFHRLATRGRWRAIVAAFVIVAAGIPTTLIDAYNAQHVESREVGPGFRWTVLMPPAHVDAMEWLRKATPARAVVQMDPYARGRDSWTTVPSFAERRMAAGLPLSLLRSPEYEQRAKAVSRMYRTADPAEALEIARELDIEYIYWDRIEHAVYGNDGRKKFDSHPELFPLLYRYEDVAIYAVH